MKPIQLFRAASVLGALFFNVPARLADPWQRSNANADCALPTLYSSPTAAWTITVRKTAPAVDKDAPKAFDAFVRARQWNALGNDPHGD